MALAVGITMLVIVVVLAFGSTICAAPFAYRRVLAEYGTLAAAMAAVAFAGVVFLGGWILFAPAWVIGAGIRRWRPQRARRRTGRVVLGVLVLTGAAAVALGIVGTIQRRNHLRRDHALETRGVRTTGVVLSVHYDPDSDPNGWTSIRASFDDYAGHEHLVTIGHHDPPAERRGDPVTILYASNQPSIATYANDPFSGSNGSAGVWIPVAIGVLRATVAGLLVCFLVRPRKSPPAGWYADPQGRSRWRFWDGQSWTPHASP